jgi:hypothetical protein
MTWLVGNNQQKITVYHAIKQVSDAFLLFTCLDNLTISVVTIKWKK